MALRGTLKDFGISDIFQLIQQQQKTGVLVMKDKDTEVRILFDGGKIVGAESSSGKQQKEPLGVLLVRAQLIKQEQLDAALAVQQKTLRKLGDLLIAEAAISKSNLKSFLALQTTETLNRLFRWKNGQYEFIPEQVKYDSEVATPMSPEHVLMDGFRMMDEWPAVQLKIRGLDSIPAIPRGMETRVIKKDRPKPGHESDEEEEDDKGGDDIDAAFAAFEDDGPSKGAKGKPGKIKLTGAESVVFALIDGIRTVQDIVDRSMLGEFNTCNALAGLIDKGVAAIIGRKKVDDSDRLHVVAERPKGEWLNLSLGGFVALAVLVVSVLAFLMLEMGERSAVSVRSSGVPQSGTMLDVLAGYAGDRGTVAAQVFFLGHGRAPKDVAELASSGLLGRADLEIPGRVLRYVPAEPVGHVTAEMAP